MSADEIRELLLDLQNLATQTEQAEQAILRKKHRSVWANCLRRHPAKLKGVCFEA